MIIEQLTGQVTSHLSELKNGILIHSSVIRDFSALQKAAKQANFNLQIASGFRSFARQSLIWNNKYSGKSELLDKLEHPIDISTISELEKLLAILHWSALPGTSRHHWGTDFDLYDPDLLPENGKLQLKVSEYTKDYFLEFNDWLTANINNYGFYRPYQTYNNGVASEPWHISYFPIANKALKQLDYTTFTT
ncbi:M15 family metallopeptidase [Psychromonas sp. MME2]|uniref:M15 family metallopeptidase n=1 Tax=Psychromonas sp. MME2 TaxID=3231033 RepID=UPI00339BE902